MDLKKKPEGTRSVVPDMEMLELKLRLGFICKVELNVVGGNTSVDATHGSEALRCVTGSVVGIDRSLIILSTELFVFCIMRYSCTFPPKYKYGVSVLLGSKKEGWRFVSGV